MKGKKRRKHTEKKEEMPPGSEAMSQGFSRAGLVEGGPLAMGNEWRKGTRAL